MGQHGYHMRVTKPREFTRPGGTLERIIDQVPAEQDVRTIIGKAVGVFLKKSGMVFHDSKRNKDAKDPNKITYSPFTRPLTESDIIAATLKLHELTDETGGEVDEPVVAIVTAEARKYYVNVKGELAGTCRLCKDGYEPLTQIVPGKFVHDSCFRDEVRRRERAASMGTTQAEAVAATL